MIRRRLSWFAFVLAFALTCVTYADAAPPRVETLAGGTKVTTYSDDQGVVRLQRDYPNGVREVENNIEHTRTVIWPDGTSTKAPIDNFARWSTDAKTGARSETDSYGRVTQIVYPDGTSTRIDYDPYSGSKRALGVTVRGPEAVGAPILQSMQRPALSQDFLRPGFTERSNEEAKKRFDWATRDSEGKRTTSQADAYWDPSTNAVTLSNALETTRLNADGTRQVDDKLQGTTRSFDENGRITKIETNPRNRNGAAHSATFGYQGDQLTKIEVAGQGAVVRQPDGSWKLPNGTTVQGDLVVGKGAITIVGNTDAKGNRRIDAFHFDDRARGYETFTQGKAQADHLAKVAKKLGGKNDAAGAAAAMEAIEGAQRALDKSDRRLLDSLATAAYKANGERTSPSSTYPQELRDAINVAASGWPLVNQREKLFDSHDYKGLGNSDLSDRIHEKAEQARGKIARFVPSLGAVGARIVEDIPAKVGGGINYVTDHPFDAVPAIAAGVAASVIAPEIMIGVTAIALTTTAVDAGNKLISGYAAGDPQMVWKGADRTGDLVVEGGAIVVTAAAFKGVGALARPISARVTKLLAPQVAPAAPAAIGAPAVGTAPLVVDAPVSRTPSPAAAPAEVFVEEFPRTKLLEIIRARKGKAPGCETLRAPPQPGAKRLPADIVERAEVAIDALETARGKPVSDSEKLIVAKRVAEIDQVAQDLGLPKGAANDFSDPTHEAAIRALNDAGLLFSGLNSSIKIPTAADPTKTHQGHVVLSKVVQALGGADKVKAMPRAERMRALGDKLSELYKTDGLGAGVKQRFVEDASALLAAIGPAAQPRYRSVTRANPNEPFTVAEAQKLVDAKGSGGTNSTATTVDDSKIFWPNPEGPIVVFEYPAGTPAAVINGEGVVMEAAVEYRTIMNQNAASMVPNEMIVGTPPNGWQVDGISFENGVHMVRLKPR